MTPLGFYRKVQTAQDAKRFRSITRTYVRQAHKEPAVKRLANAYRSPSGFASWADHVALCRSLVEAWASRPLKELEPGQALSFLFFQFFESTQAPPRFLDPGLAESLHHTDLAPPGEEPPIALPFFRLFLPKGLIRLDTGSSVDVALVADRQRVTSLLALDQDERGPGLAILFPIETGETFFIDFIWEDPNSQRLDTSSPWSAAITKAARLCAHAVMVMAYMPELVTAEPSRRQPGGRGFGQDDKDLPVPAAPIWIGRHYERQVEQGRPRSSAPGDQAPLRRAHWRRGHWRSVACGTKRLERRMRWIQPVFVNAGSSAAPEGGLQGPRVLKG